MLGWQFQDPCSKINIYSTIRLSHETLRLRTTREQVNAPSDLM